MMIYALRTIIAVVCLVACVSIYTTLQSEPESVNLNASIRQNIRGSTAIYTADLKTGNNVLISTTATGGEATVTAALNQTRNSVQPINNERPLIASSVAQTTLDATIRNGAALLVPRVYIGNVEINNSVASLATTSKKTDANNNASRSTGISTDVEAVYIGDHAFSSINAVYTASNSKEPHIIFTDS